MLSRLPSTELHLIPTEIPDILHHVFKYCESLELCKNICLVCSSWNQVAKHKNIWHFHCDQLWKGKLFIILMAINKRISSPYLAYKISYIDRKRNVISYDELTRIKWNFRLKYRSHHFGDKDITVCQFTKQHVLKLPPFGEFNWKFVKGRFTKWRGKSVYDNDSDDDINKTNFGWIEYMKKYEKEKNRNAKRNRLRKKFENFNRAKVANSLKDGIKQLRRKLSIKKNVVYDDVNNPKMNEEENTAEQQESYILDYREDDDFTIKAPNDDANEGRYIQCNQYPPLHVFRDKDWGFILENKWVIFTSY